MFRAANARTLIEQSIGRGLRLPYGKRTGVDAVDRLNIVAHDRFQEIVDEANNPQNPLRLRQVILDAPEDDVPRESVAIKSNLEEIINGTEETDNWARAYPTGAAAKPIFESIREKEAAQKTLQVLTRFQHKPDLAPTAKELLSSELQQAIVNEVAEQLTDKQQSLMEEGEKLDLAAVVATATQLMVAQTIDIPRIVVEPKGDISYGYNPFTLELCKLNLQPSNRELISQSLQTNAQISISALPQKKYQRLEDYIVEHLVDKDDISYDEHADLIYDLAGQAVAFFSDVKAYSDDELHNIFFGHGKLLSNNIHAQMAEHFWEKATGYEVKVSAGFTPLKEAAYTKATNQPVHNYRDTVKDVGKIKQMLFGGFSKCLYSLQKFDSDTERRFSVILERDALKWFKPVIGQFQIIYKLGVEHKDYVPDFVAELDDSVLMVETKARADMEDPAVQAKAESAKEWCKNASEYLQENGGKPWCYVLIAHDDVVENRVLTDFLK